MRLRECVHSTSHDGARSGPNRQYLDGLHHGSQTDTPGTSISIDQTAYCGIPCTRIHFHPPQMFQATGITSIPVLVPTAWTGIYRHSHQKLIIYSLIEELIRWLAGVGPVHTPVDLYRSNHGQEHARSYLSAWHELHPTSCPALASSAGRWVTTSSGNTTCWPNSVSNAWAASMVWEWGG